MKLACCAPWIKEQRTRLDFFRSWKKEHGIIMLDPVKCVIVSADGFIKKILVLTYQQLTIKNDV